jgi:cell wall-associated NlpC family hydrolase
MTESELRQAIVGEARSWAGTPFVDRGTLKMVGVDCAGFPLMVYRKVGLLPKDFVLPAYSPQAGMDRHKEDTTYLDLVLKFAKREITEAEARPGYFVLWKVVNSWRHGGIIVSWPFFVLHPLVGRGVVGSHGTQEGFLKGRQRRFFTLVG